MHKKTKNNYSQEEKRLIIRSLLKRFKDGRATHKEKRVLNKLQSDHFLKKKSRLSKAELDLLEDRQRGYLSQKLNIPLLEKSDEKQRRQLSISPITYGGVAAAAIIFLFIAVNWARFYQGKNTTSALELTAEKTLSNQFVTNKNMKRIMLADGSVIHLNMGTTLSLYKGKFNAYAREVWLDEGEAFFEVAKDANRPFIVHTADGLTTKVLGTSFNIKAYRELGEQVVSVKTGRVQVSKKDGEKVLLDPDNKVTLHSFRGSLTTGFTDGSAVADWRTGRIVLDHVKIKELAFRLQQYYGVNVINNHAIESDAEIYTSFKTNTPLEHVLNNIADIFGISYQIEDNKVYFN